jgi:hypothetical protein
MCRKCIDHIHPCLSILPYRGLFYIPILYCLGVCSLFKGVLPEYFTVNTLYLNQFNPLYYSFLPFPSYPVLFTSFQCISLCPVLIQMWCISLLFTLHHSLLFFPPLLSSNSPTIWNMFIYIVYTYMYIW